MEHPQPFLAEFLVLFLGGLMFLNMLRVHRSLITYYRPTGRPRWRAPIMTILLVLILHELVGWKFHFGLPFFSEPNEIIFSVGLVILVFGLALNMWSFDVMAQHMLPPETVPHSSEKQLVTTGPFRYLRNPTYLSYLLVFTGAQMVALCPLVFLSPVLHMNLRRWARREETILSEAFPTEYPVYYAQTWRGL